MKLSRSRLMRAGVFGGGEVQFTYQVLVTGGQSTTPKFSFGAGAPAAVVDFGDGTTPEAVTSGVEMNHTYTNAGTYTVELIAPNQKNYLTQIDIHTDKVISVETPIQAFQKLILFYGGINAGWSQDIRPWTIPPLMAYLSISSCPLLSGVISNWVLPASLVQIGIGATGLSGDISNWVLPAVMTSFSNNYNMLITGCPVLSSMVAIQTINCSYCSLLQVTVDLYLSRCVAREASTTYATPALNLDGNYLPGTAGYANMTTLLGNNWVVTPNEVPPTVPDVADTGVWSLKFGDTFATIDTAKWTKYDWHDDDGAIVRIYDPDYLSVNANGLMVTADKDINGVYRFGTMNTANKFSFLYGYVETRAKWPMIDGMWINIFPLGTTAADNAINLTEMAQKEFIQVSSHKAGVSNYMRLRNTDFDFTQYHKFGAYWTATRVTVYIDDIPVYHSAIGVPIVSQFLVIFMEIGNDFVPKVYPLANDLPVEMDVEYMKVWQLI